MPVVGSRQPRRKPEKKKKKNTTATQERTHYAESSVFTARLPTFREAHALIAVPARNQQWAACLSNPPATNPVVLVHTLLHTGERHHSNEYEQSPVCNIVIDLHSILERRDMEKIMIGFWMPLAHFGFFQYLDLLVIYSQNLSLNMCCFKNSCWSDVDQSGIKRCFFK